MSRLGDNIRSIARTKELQDKLKELAARIPIPGQRGIGYTSSDGTNTTTGTPGESTANNVGGDKTTTDPSRVDENGNPINTTPGSSSNPNDNPDQSSEIGSDVTDSGESDISELLDFDTDKIGDKLTALTGLSDCDTGKDVVLRFDGKFQPPEDGSWTEGSTPPTDTTWVSGKTWALGSFVGASPLSVASQFVSYTNETAAYGGGPPPVRIAVYTIESLVPTPMSTDSYDFEIKNTRLDINSETSSSVGPILASPCTPSGSDPLCPTQAPALKWPDTIQGTYPNYTYNVDTIQLSVNQTTGFIERSPYDAINRELTDFPPAGQANTNTPPKTDATLCFANGRQLKVETNSIGGKTIYETTPSGRLIGTTRVYDKNSILVSKIY